MDLIREMRRRAKTEEVDYLFLMDCLSHYKQPRSKLTSLLKAGVLVRVKKGLYVFGKGYANRPFSLEVLANLIYGPSYVSYEYALAYYELIPERVPVVTSASSKRIKHFLTPVGTFVYHYLALKKFSVGITWASLDEATHFLIATREKALADTVARMKSFPNRDDLFQYLVEGMRIEEEELKKLRPSLLVEIAAVYQNKNVTLLSNTFTNGQSTRSSAAHAAKI
ncbi:MAG: hypothetical protein K940chlam9_00847 [Chlamydiae bacterium]|nr:hypothetical protein [Chlamydiota bacterium]